MLVNLGVSRPEAREESLHLILEELLCLFSPHSKDPLDQYLNMGIIAGRRGQERVVGVEDVVVCLVEGRGGGKSSGCHSWRLSGDWTSGKGRSMVDGHVENGCGNVGSGKKLAGRGGVGWRW